jgi:hypothetical protein
MSRNKFYDPCAAKMNSDGLEQDTGTNVQTASPTRLHFLPSNGCSILSRENPSSARLFSVDGAGIALDQDGRSELGN